MVDRVGTWNWSSYRAMTGETQTPPWLSSDYVLLQFGASRKTAIKRYKAYVEAGLMNEPIWSQITNQIYLGSPDFVEKVQQHLTDRKDDVQIPRAQKRPMPKSLLEYEKLTTSRDKAIVQAYGSGGYSYQELGDHFGLHFTRIGKIIRGSK